MHDPVYDAQSFCLLRVEKAGTHLVEKVKHLDTFRILLFSHKINCSWPSSWNITKIFQDLFTHNAHSTFTLIQSVPLFCLHRTFFFTKHTDLYSMFQLPNILSRHGHLGRDYGTNTFLFTIRLRPQKELGHQSLFHLFWKMLIHSHSCKVFNTSTSLTLLIFPICTNSIHKS